MSNTGENGGTPLLNPDRIKAKRANAEKLKQIALSNYNSAYPDTWHAVAEKNEVNYNALMGAVKRLKKAGYMPKRMARPIVDPRTLQNAALEPAEMGSGTDAPAKAAEVELFEALAELDPAKRRARLDYIAQTAPAAVQVQAIKLREDLDRIQAVSVGPPTPSTEAEWDQRLGLILLAAGPERVQRAINWAAAQTTQAEAQSGQETPSPSEEQASPEPSNGGSGVG